MRIMAGISEMYIFLHLSNSHFFFKKKYLSLGIGSGKGQIKRKSKWRFFSIALNIEEHKYKHYICVKWMELYINHCECKRKVMTISTQINTFFWKKKRNMKDTYRKIKEKLSNKRINSKWSFEILRLFS